MSRTLLWKRALIAAFLLFLPFEAQATKFKPVSGLMGMQDKKSKELLALSPAEAGQAATHDLTSLLTPTGKFLLDNSRNVEGIVFFARPYPITYRSVCRADRVTLLYRYRFSPASKESSREPVGVEAQPTYHIGSLPVPGFIPGTSYKVADCDHISPLTSSGWFAAPNDRDAVRAANMFRRAVDEVKTGRLKPGPCDKHGAQSCEQWLIALDDPSKIVSIAPCPADRDEVVCYSISFDTVDVTITGSLSFEDRMAITPAIISSVRVEDVIIFMP